MKDDQKIEFYDSFTGKTYYLTVEEVKHIEEEFMDSITIEVDCTITDLMENT